jgi:hypothetical protein
MKVKDLSASATKFQTRAQAAGPAYTAGVQSPKKPWAASAAAAAPTWAAGVQAAANNGRFAKGVAKAGDSKWSANSAGKGSSRYAQGVSAAGPNWQAGFQPYAAVLGGLTLPPRGVKGDPNNNNIVLAISQALHKAKQGS